jgi:hypothetical protein
MKAKFGMIITEGRGKLGGHVMTKNRYGAAVRSKVTPINRRTTAQQNVRASLTATAQAWRGLTDAGRAAWDMLASQVTTRNIFGDAAAMTGLTLFMRLNRELNNIGASAITVAPTIPAISSVLSLTLTAAVTGSVLTLAYTPTPVPAGHSMVVEATPQLSAGRGTGGSKYTKLAVVAAAAASPYDGYTTYTAKYGSLIATTKIFMRAKLVHVATGFSSGWVAVSDVVAA